MKKLIITMFVGSSFLLLQPVFASQEARELCEQQFLAQCMDKCQKTNNINCTQVCQENASNQCRQAGV